MSCITSASLQAWLKAEFGPLWSIFTILPVSVTESKKSHKQVYAGTTVFSENCWDIEVKLKKIKGKQREQVHLARKHNFCLN